MLNYQNNWYKIAVSPAGELTVSDLTDAVIVAGYTYSSRYCVMTNGESPVLGANQNYIHLRAVDLFEVGDEIEICTKKINDSILHVAEVTAVDTENKVLHFTPATPSNFAIPAWESQSPLGTVTRKITYEANSLSGVVAQEETTQGGKNLVIAGETDVAFVTLRFLCRDNSPSIEVEVETEYRSDVRVLNESISLVFVDDLKAIYAKNRQVKKGSFPEKVWLGNQGAMFGEGDRTAFFYHVTGVCSIEVEPTSKKAVFNLDDYRDHRYRVLDQYRVGYTEGMWLDRNTAEFSQGSIRRNKFSLYVGFDVAAVPRFMTNPYGYLSTVVWESHADNAYIPQLKALLYGHQDISTPEEAVGGLVYHGLLATLTFFYGGESYSFRGPNWQTDPDARTEAFYIAKAIRALGYDIGYHSLFWSTENPSRIPDEVMIQAKNEALPFLIEHFGYSPTWVDHSPQQNALDMSTEALDSSSPAYLAELWEQYGTKYFWSHSSEDGNRDTLDILVGSDDGVRSPLYWRHPTVTRDFITKATMYNSPGGQAGWATNYSKENLEHLLKYWGVHIFHQYLPMSDRSAVIKDENNKWVINPVFEDVLTRLRGYMDAGKINVTTTRDIMDYWLGVESLEMSFVSSEEIDIKNTGTVSVKGVSMVIESPYYGVYVNNMRPERKWEDGNMVFWFDIEPAETKRITLKHELPYKFISNHVFVNPL